VPRVRNGSFKIEGKIRVGYFLGSKKQEENAYALLTFSRYPKEIREFLYMAHQLERLAKEIKRMKDMNERLNLRRLRGLRRLNRGTTMLFLKKIFTQ
jgi:transposase-like protein